MKLDCEFDDGLAGGGAIGLIVLRTDETVEFEAASVFQKAQKACFHSRIPSHALVTSETLLEMEADLPAAAGLLPKGTDFGAIGYACTSGATVIGPQNVAKAIHQHYPGVPTSDPLSSVIAALKHLKVRKLAVLTPYVPEVTHAMQKVLTNEGFEITSLGAFEEAEDRRIARITEASTLAALLKVGRGDVDAVFASCTNLRTFQIIEQAESQLGKPVISSNLALVWNLLRLSGTPTKGMGPGRLFSD